MAIKADIEVGQRVVEELNRLYPKHSVREMSEKIGINLNPLLWNWKTGTTSPSAYALQRLAQHGADVHYILTGVRSRSNEKY